MAEQQKVLGYLPDERPQENFHALQQVIVMFPATVVALITGLASTTIHGLATIFILITGATPCTMAAPLPTDGHRQHGAAEGIAE